MPLSGWIFATYNRGAFSEIRIKKIKNTKYQQQKNYTFTLFKTAKKLMSDTFYNNKERNTIIAESYWL